MTRTELLLFMRRHFWGVVATTSASGAPQAAVVGIATTDAFELVFDTLTTTRKAINIRRASAVAVVIGWDEEQTVQYEGVADEPTGLELERLQRVYFAQFPDGPSRLSWPGIAYFRVRPTWIRYSDYRADESSIEEFTSDQLAGASSRSYWPGQLSSR